MRRIRLNAKSGFEDFGLPSNGGEHDARPGLPSGCQDTITHGGDGGEFAGEHPARYFALAGDEFAPKIDPTWP
jgi:hypothetical protein